jgi:hypothetical protein
MHRPKATRTCPGAPDRTRGGRPSPPLEACDRANLRGHSVPSSVQARWSVRFDSSNQPRRRRWSAGGRATSPRGWCTPAAAGAASTNPSLGGDGFTPCSRPLDLKDAGLDQTGFDLLSRDRGADADAQAEDAVFHRSRVRAFREHHASSGVAQRLDVLHESVRQLGIHAGPAADPASLVERHIFKCNGRGC